MERRRSSEKKPEFIYRKPTKTPASPNKIDLKEIVKSPMKKSNNRSDNLVVNTNFGRKPEYLINFDQKRMLEKQREEYLKYLMDTIPAGKRVVQETERQSKLKILHDSKVELMRVIESFPIQRINVKRSQYMER